MELEIVIEELLDEHLCPIKKMAGEILEMTNGVIGTCEEIDEHLDNIEESFCNIERNFSV